MEQIVVSRSLEFRWVLFVGCHSLGEKCLKISDCLVEFLIVHYFCFIYIYVSPQWFKVALSLIASSLGKFKGVTEETLKW